MPLKFEWIDTQKSIMTCTGEGMWTWDEYHEALDEIASQFRLAQRRVDLIIIRAAGSATPKGSSMPHYQRAMRIMPPNLGLMVMVTTNAFARTIVSIFSKVYPNKDNIKLVMVGTLADAQARIVADRLKQAQAA
ncbi:MAG: hypothetical protein LCI00_25280 [Chloroflexi bacterium]|nr:hypothetical protein [Chloroflexota bacterium]MCC6896807.1 hypothetical protein [Anaerolineae bacterium]